MMHVNLSRVLKLALCTTVNSLQECLKQILPSIDKHMRKIKQQEEIMLKDVQNVYDIIIAKVNEMYGRITNEIQMSCQTRIDLLTV